MSGPAACGAAAAGPVPGPQSAPPSAPPSAPVAAAVADGRADGLAEVPATPAADVPAAPVADVLAIVVSYNTRALTLAALASLAAQRPAPAVVVVDNASTDGSAEAVAGRFPDIRLLRQTVNLGFGRAVNLAAATAPSRRILLLNPDARLDDGALARLVAVADANPGHGIYGGRTTHPDGRVNPDSCSGKITVWSAACMAFGLARAFRGSRIFDAEALAGWGRDTTREVDVVFGCFCLIDRDVWQRLGGFDRRYWLYGEDADLCLRSARLLGRRPLFTPAAEARHVGAAASPDGARQRMLLAKGRATVARRHWPARWRWLVWPLGTVWAGSRAAAETLAGCAARAAGRPAAAPVWREVWRRRAEWRDGY